MKRIFLVALLAATVLSVPMTAHAADWRYTHCRYARLDHRAGFSTREVARTIECATSHWSVPGGTAKALDVARCESGLDPSNSYGSFRGVYQWGSQWGQAVDKYRAFRARWDVAASVWNARANVLITIRVVHAGSWDPWSCA